MNNDYNNKSVMKSEELNTSLGYVSIYKDNIAISEYEGCVYKEKKYFATAIPECYIDESNRYEIMFYHLKQTITATFFSRANNTDITILELPHDRCESLNPIDVETKHKVEWGDDVYIPRNAYTDGIVRSNPEKVCPCNGYLFITGGVDVRFLGSPLLNSQGKLIGLITACNLWEEEVLELGEVSNSIQDPIQKAYLIKKVSTKSDDRPSATAFDGVPCQYE